MDPSDSPIDETRPSFQAITSEGEENHKVFSSAHAPIATPENVCDYYVLYMLSGLRYDPTRHASSVDLFGHINPQPSEDEAGADSVPQLQSAGVAERLPQLNDSVESSPADSTLDSGVDMNASCFTLTSPGMERFVSRQSFEDSALFDTDDVKKNEDDADLDPTK